jgi:hypothetical protein
MKGRIDREFDYRAGMTADCSEALRVLRRSGFAVAILKPEAVGHPMHRGNIEQAMVIRGVQRANELSHSNILVKGQR